MKTQDLFRFNRSADRINESIEKTFGQRLNLESFDLQKLEDARNKLRTQIHDARNQSGFNENLDNEALTKAQWMLDTINAEIAEREEFVSDAGQAEVEEGHSPEVEEFFQKIANGSDEGYDMLYDAHSGKFGRDIMQAVDDMYQDIVIDTGYHADDDFEDIYSRMMDNIEADYADKDVKEGVMSEIAAELGQVADDEDFDKLYDLLSDDGPVGEYLQDKIQDITGETGLHPKDDFEQIEKMLMDMVQKEFGGQNDDEGGETDDDYAMKSAGFGSDEDYGDFGRDESIQGEDMSKVTEGEVQQASAIVTAKTMVDRVGRWIEELSGMENDTLLQLGDSIRDEMSQEQAKTFISAVAPAIQQALENLKTTRETLATGVRTLTGEEQGAEMLGGEPSADMGGEEEMGPVEPDAMNAGGEELGDEFAAAEPAAGGVDAAGREQRENIDRSSTLLRLLAG